MTLNGEELGTAERQRLRCFVIGPIGNRFATPGTPERENYEEAIQVLEEIIVPACRLVGLTATRADGLTRAGEITEQVFRRLRDDDIVIADLTSANANVMYELGMRHTRNLLTVQVGEYGRLPFDINTIRTVQFSRSTHGLITARNELVRLLETGLAGEFDPVGATRIWNESQDASANLSDLSPDATSETSHEDQPEPPGFIDLIAEAEENQQPLIEAIQEIGVCLADLGQRAESASQRMAESDARGAGMRGRLTVATQFAHEVDAVANKLEVEVDKYESAISAVSAGNLAIIERLEEDPAQLSEAMDVGRLLRQLAARAREGLESQQGFVASMNEAARASRVLRAPARRISNALDRFATATQAMDEWDRRLQALGVDLPPDDWEYPTPDN